MNTVFDNTFEYLMLEDLHRKLDRKDKLLERWLNNAYAMTCCDHVHDLMVETETTLGIRNPDGTEK